MCPGNSLLLRLTEGLGVPVADGFTFTIQNTSPYALGGSQAGLGYVGIHHSLAVKFDLLNNAGEGPNSVGVFTAGNILTVPAIDLTGSGIDLHSGHIINAQISGLWVTQPHRD